MSKRGRHVKGTQNGTSTDKRQRINLERMHWENNIFCQSKGVDRLVRTGQGEEGNPNLCGRNLFKETLACGVQADLVTVIIQGLGEKEAIKEGFYLN